MSRSSPYQRLLLQWLLPIACGVAVTWYFYKQLRNPALNSFQWSWDLLWYCVPVGFLYLGCQTIWGSFWIQLTRRFGIELPWWIGLRGYFVSQFGKYVPGKIWVIWLRTSMIGRLGANRVIVAFTSTYETLVSMAAGALLGFGLVPLVILPQDRVWSAWWFLPIGFLPLTAPLLRRLIIRIARKRRGNDSFTLPKVSILFLCRGLLQDAIGWIFLGISLRILLEGLVPGRLEWSITLLLQLTAANAIAYVLGFVVLFMPAGGAIRELALQQLLIPILVASGENSQYAAGIATLSAILLRLIWTLFEVLFATTLYRWVKIPAKNEPAITGVTP